MQVVKFVQCVQIAAHERYTHGSCGAKNDDKLIRIIDEVVFVLGEIEFRELSKSDDYTEDDPHGSESCCEPAIDLVLISDGSYG